jgi:hypothetical protein
VLRRLAGSVDDRDRRHVEASFGPELGGYWDTERRSGPGSSKWL